MNRLLLLLLATVVAFLLNIFIGSVHIPMHDVWASLSGDEVSDIVRFIILDSRLPQALTALLAGSALAVCGLLLQTLFHNPLAGPSVLGISGGASLGVALVTLINFSLFTFHSSLLLAAFCGSTLVTVLLLALSRMIRNNIALLIAGLLLGYLISAAITLLYTIATPTGLQRFIGWGMGDFSSVNWAQMPMLTGLVLIGLLGSMLLVKALNALQLGESYAANLGVQVNRLRSFILLITGILTAVVTAYCGPVAFIGLASPHIARLFIRSADFRRLLPATILTGALVALLCNLLCVMPSTSVLPLNAVTPIIGVPVIIWLMVPSRSPFRGE